MICVTLFEKKTTGFTVKGHAEMDEEGRDIVCAAVTSAVRLTECQLKDVLKLKPEVTVSNETTEISVIFKEYKQEARPALDAFGIYMKTLAGEYPGYIKVMEA